MKKNFLAFLFGESQVDDEIAGIVESIADIDTDGAGDLKVEKKPLASALSSLGIEAKNLENDPRGLSLVFSSAEDYRAAHAILNEPDSLHKLAELGWVYSTQGDVAMANEPAELRIRFLEIDNIEPSDTKASYSDSDKARLDKAKAIIKSGREFATEAPDFDYDTNPVDHADPKKGKRDKGVSDAKDGADPEGTPKGSEGSPSAGSSGSAPAKGDLVQPKEGDKAKLRENTEFFPTRNQHMASIRPTRPPPTFRGDATQPTDAPQSASHPYSPNCDCYDCSVKHVDPRMSKNAGVLHAPGCGCAECAADPIGMSSAATRQGRGRPGTVPFSAAAGHYGESKKSLAEAHKSGCQCGFCKNKGNIGNYRKGKKADKPEKPEGEVEESTAAEIVNTMLEGNPGTPEPVLGKGKDRSFRPAKGMVQAAPEGSVVAKQTKPNRSA